MWSKEVLLLIITIQNITYFILKERIVNLTLMIHDCPTATFDNRLALYEYTENCIFWM